MQEKCDHIQADFKKMIDSKADQVQEIQKKLNEVGLPNEYIFLFASRAEPNSFLCRLLMGHIPRKQCQEWNADAINPEMNLELLLFYSHSTFV